MPLQQIHESSQDRGSSEETMDSEWEREEKMRYDEEMSIAEARRLEARRVDEVKRTYESLEGQRGPRISLADSLFSLYCLEYFDDIYNTDCQHDPLIKYVRFEHQPGNRKDGLPPAGRRRVNGKVFLDTAAEPTFKPFVVPRYASKELIRQRSSHDRKNAMAIRFLSDDHLIFRLSRKVVFAPELPPPDVPEDFVFYGIRHRKELVLEETPAQTSLQPSQSSCETPFDILDWWRHPEIMI
ncbi:uncharacterized protein BO80DRAFT_425081 [Aspergillus ibericus CBS 121593]|uniref:Uncharacterized protein n=1 Tax=Aspergillus ibericus CBS 121593 TaxID=1448316 RepID=A0A395GZX1_9EURO|nr:hypothetical protein BO80DRAFT_425081 [Aspergillus ibericus CBS 121593]RAL01106.1 hypothetical protein BO80DRAFT_425081 [Aspergillus ibericus CBS 121593]